MSGPNRSSPPSAGSGGGASVFTGETPPPVTGAAIWVPTDVDGNQIDEAQYQAGVPSNDPTDVDAIQGLATGTGVYTGIGADEMGFLETTAADQGKVVSVGPTGALELAAGGGEAPAPIPGVLAPGNLVEVTSFSAPGANTMRGCRVIVPEWATHIHRFWVATGSPSGNVRGAIYDVGATTNAVRTRLFDGASTPAIAGWTLLGDASMAVVGGQHLDFAAVPDGTTNFGRRALGGGNETALPSGLATVGGCLYKVAWQNAVGSFANPATLSEAAASGAVSGLPIIIAELS